MALIELTAIALASATVSSKSDVKEAEDIIRISNVCLSIRHGYSYSISSNSDFFQIKVTNNEAIANIYIGHNPEILGVNRKWQSRSIRSKIKKPKIVALEGDQSGQILGIPVDENDQFFHLWFESGSRSSGLTKDIVRFCK